MGFVATHGQDDILRTLFRVGLGKPTGPIGRADGVSYRPYERGLVAVNPTKKRYSDRPSSSPVTARLPLPALCPEPSDLYTGTLVPCVNGRLEATVPEESGRVFVDRRAMAESFLEEVRLSAAQAGGQLLGFWRPSVVTTVGLLRQVEKHAELAKASMSMGDRAKAAAAFARVPELVGQLPESAADRPPDDCVNRHLANLAKYVLKAHAALRGQ
jgi:hypothetical protein